MNSRRVVLIYIQVLLLALVTDYTGWTNSYIPQVSALRSRGWRKLLCCCGNGGGCGGDDPVSGSGPEGNDNEGYESDGDGPIPPPPPMPPPPPPIPPPPPSPPPQPIPPSPPVMLPRAKLRRDGDPGGRPSILPQSENNPFVPPKGPPKGLPNGLFEFLDDDDTDSNGSGGNPSDEVFV